MLSLMSARESEPSQPESPVIPFRGYDVKRLTSDERQDIQNACNNRKKLANKLEVAGLRDVKALFCSRRRFAIEIAFTARVYLARRDVPLVFFYQPQRNAWQRAHVLPHMLDSEIVESYGRSPGSVESHPVDLFETRRRPLDISSVPKTSQCGLMALPREIRNIILHCYLDDLTALYIQGDMPPGYSLRAPTLRTIATTAKTVVALHQANKQLYDETKEEIAILRRHMPRRFGITFTYGTGTDFDRLRTILQGADPQSEVDLVVWVTQDYTPRFVHSTLAMIQQTRSTPTKIFLVYTSREVWDWRNKRVDPALEGQGISVVAFQAVSIIGPSVASQTTDDSLGELYRILSLHTDTFPTTFPTTKAIIALNKFEDLVRAIIGYHPVGTQVAQDLWLYGCQNAYMYISQVEADVIHYESGVMEDQSLSNWALEPTL